jgi:hypothetical protein
MRSPYVFISTMARAARVPAKIVIVRSIRAYGAIIGHQLEVHRDGKSVPRFNMVADVYNVISAPLAEFPQLRHSSIACR